MGTALLSQSNQLLFNQELHFNVNGGRNLARRRQIAHRARRPIMLYLRWMSLLIVVPMKKLRGQSGLVTARRHAQSCNHLLSISPMMRHRWCSKIGQKPVLGVVAAPIANAIVIEAGSVWTVEITSVRSQLMLNFHINTSMRPVLLPVHAAAFAEQQE
jgi:hypothetical protein